MPRRPSDVPRDRVVAYARAMTACPLPDAELDRMAGTTIASTSSSQPRANAKCARGTAESLLGEIRVDEHHPLLGLHRAWLAGAHTEGPVRRYDSMTSSEVADKYHQDLVHSYGAPELANALHDD
jgi:hypothetical protein